MSSDSEPETVAEILRRHHETERVYANYWKFSLDRQLEERHIAAHLLAYLETREGWTGAKVESSDRDPPDCLGTATGRTFGIEVTELVDEKSAADHQLRRQAEKRGAAVPAHAPDPWETALWTAPVLDAALRRIVARKDKAPLGGPFTDYLVAICTDETMVTPELVTEVMAALTIETVHLDGAYLLLSYDPRAEEFPNRTPVFRLPVAKRPAL